MPTTFGDVTRTLFYKSDTHKLFNEFEVTAEKAVVKGQPVFLHTDGTVTAAISTTTTQEIIGVAMHSGKAGELITVMMKAFLITFAEAGKALNAGPVAISGAGINTAEDRVLVTGTEVTHTNQVGWALDAATEVGDEVMVAWL